MLASDLEWSFSRADGTLRVARTVRPYCRISQLIKATDWSLDLPWKSRRGRAGVYSWLNMELGRIQADVPGLSYTLVAAEG
jgi:hypothetical protein